MTSPIKVILSFTLSFCVISAQCINFSVIDMAFSIEKTLEDQDSIYIPFTYSRNLILIEGSVNNEAGYWILDTGAPKIILNERYAENVWDSEDMTWRDASGKVATVKNTFAKSVSIGIIQINQLRALTTDLTAIEAERNKKIIGLLGVEFLTPYDVRIDSRQLKITLFKRGTFQEDLMYRDLVRSKFYMQANRMMINTNIDNTKYQLLFDTGAEVCLISRKLAERKKTGYTLNRYTKLLTSQSDTLVSMDCSIRDVDLGDLKFVTLRVLVRNTENSSLDGAIGHDLLKLGVVHIDFGKRNLMIYPYDSEPAFLAETKKATP